MKQEKKEFNCHLDLYWNKYSVRIWWQLTIFLPINYAYVYAELPKKIVAVVGRHYSLNILQTESKLLYMCSLTDRSTHCSTCMLSNKSTFSVFGYPAIAPNSLSARRTD